MSRCFGAVLLFFGCFSLPAQAQVNMKWKFEKGDTFFMEEIQDMKMNMTFFGNTQKVETKTTTTTKFTVLDKTSDGNIVLERRIESMKMSSPMSLPGADDMAKQMEGVTFKITLKPTMEVSKIEGLDEFLDRIGKANPGSEQAFRALFSENTLKASIGDAFGSLPNQAVKAGDKWNRKTSFPMGPLGSIDAESSFVYEGPQDSLQKVTFKGNLSFQPPKGAAAAFPGLQNLKTEFKPEEFQGALFFDPARGRVSRGDAKMRGKLTMSGTANGQNLEIVMDIDMKITSQVYDKKPADSK
jgi:hypothetical protein